MNSLRRNIVANFTGGVWIGIISLLFIPLYVRYMGIESYGLVGFFLTLQAMLSLLDGGLSTTLNREFARLSVAEDAVGRMQRLLRTFEAIYWVVAIGAGILIVLAAPWITLTWVKPDKLSVSTVQNAIVLMGVSFVVQWPLSLYTGGLMGLQRQVQLMIINASAATVRGVGAVLVLAFISPTVLAFFLWQIMAGFLHTAAVAVAAWRGIGGVRGAKFDRVLLHSTWRFAAGITAISVLSTALTQIDKLLLSRMLSLEAFGYYVFAGTVAASLYRVITPVFSAVFPRFSQLAAAGAEGQMVSLYHDTQQMVSVVVLPAAVFIAVFSFEVLSLWTGDSVMAGKTHALLSMLIMGTAMNGILSVPYAVQLAYGWTRLVILTNIVAVAVIVPLVLILASRFGALGAAFGWFFYNAAASIITPAILHARVLSGELRRWYFVDVGAPLIAGLVVALSARMLLPRHSLAGMRLVLSLAVIAFVMQLISALSAPSVRKRLLVTSRRGLTRLGFSE